MKETEQACSNGHSHLHKGMPVIFRRALSIACVTLAAASLFFLAHAIPLFADGQHFSALRNYVQLQFSPNISMDNQTMTKLDQACQEFYNSTHMDSILFEISDELKYACITNTLDQIPPEQRYVYLNNGYLTLNPIYDSDGHAIAVDENAYQLTILAPEECALTDSELTDRFQATATMKYFYTEGAKIENETAFPIIPTKIIHYPTGQSFFLCTQEYRTKLGTSIIDPIVIVATKGNTSPYMHSHYQTSGAYMVTRGAATVALSESGIDAYVSNIKSPYSLFQKSIFYDLLIAFILLCVSILCFTFAHRSHQLR